MNKILKYFKNRNWLLIAAVCFITLSAMSTVCMADYRSVTTTTTGAGDTHTTKTVERSNESRGLIGSAFHLVGQVIIFPFKVIGSIF